MARKLFGTDGIRGRANTYPMTAELALKVAMAAGHVFTRGGHQHRVVVGKDTRRSSYVIETAMVAGFASVGMNSFFLGPMPTPAVAMLTRSLRADLGVMISASHNPYQDNGIKLFGPDGFKLSDEIECEIERLIESDLTHTLAAPETMGKATRVDGVGDRYIESIKRSVPRDLTLDGVKVVIDCANGAGYRVAPDALWELGAEVVPMAVEPNGFNINDGCGSTAPEALQARVIAEGAAIGIALDGDADRVIIVDETGAIVDGDQLLALIGESWSADGRLTGDSVVATVMSNLGLERYLGGLGLRLARTPVGDRYVVEEMRATGCNVGGEQSGHIVLTDYATTGDGLLTALQVLAVVVASGKPVSQVCRRFLPVPQLLQNVRFAGGRPLDAPEVQQVIEAGRLRLGNRGRVLIRPSGTEPVIRVMAEGDDEALVAAVVGDICGALTAAAA